MDEDPANSEFGSAVATISKVCEALVTVFVGNLYVSVYTLPLGIHLMLRL